MLDTGGFHSISKHFFAAADCMRMTSRIYRYLMLSIVVAVPVSAAYGEEGPPPEIARTVDAFVGHWTLNGSDMEPGAKTPAPVKAIIDCKPAALGRGKGTRSSSSR